ncbi:MAG TPA: SDR family oxidoreductase, partial [Candidatus Dormibacteraeota bacterium]|nr:SDR family oxidoreductase [Candidatus Dormibacteraeota bacterium]
MGGFDLSGKSIVVVGGTTGIGFSAAQTFIAHGARVVVVGRNAKSVKDAQGALGTDGFAFSGDAVNPRTAVRAIRAAVSKFGGFHGLYHVAGGSGRSMGDGPLHEITDEGWRKTLNLNLTSLMLSNRAAVQQFLSQRTGGTILNISSVLGWSPSIRHFATHGYAASKAAVLGFSQAIAAYYAPTDIRVNVLAPALVETPMARRAVGD